MLLQPEYVFEDYSYHGRLYGPSKKPWEETSPEWSIGSWRKSYRRRRTHPWQTLHINSKFTIFFVEKGVQVIPVWCIDHVGYLVLFHPRCRTELREWVLGTDWTGHTYLIWYSFHEKDFVWGRRLEHPFSPLLHERIVAVHIPFNLIKR